MEARWELLRHYTEEQVEAYEETLDSEGDVVIGSLRYTPSQVLMSVDPIAYKLGMDNFADSMGWQPKQYLTIALAKEQGL